MRYLLGTILVLIVGVAAAQSPPPRPLPASITGTNVPPVAPVRPAGGVQAPPTAPISKFANLLEHPPETVAAVYAVRAGADWLWRMHQPSGRFLPGYNPTARLVVDVDSDLRQAVAALALADAARFTGDDRLTARATQAVVTLYTLTKLDGERRVPSVPTEATAFAATLALATYHLPEAEPSMLAKADGLCSYLRMRTPVEPPSGMIVQALTAYSQRKPDPELRTLLGTEISRLGAAFRAKPTMAMASSALPAIVGFALGNGKDPATVAIAIEMADFVCACQITQADARSLAWVGGFRPAPTSDQIGTEPTFTSASAAQGLALATTLTRHIPDATRFVRYRQATLDGLAFTRRLQYTDLPATDAMARFLTGGGRLSPSVGTVQTDATAAVVAAHLAFLTSGAEGRTE